MQPKVLTDLNPPKRPVVVQLRLDFGALLTKREKQIVQLVTQDCRNKEIGGKLLISENTVRNHLHNIFRKLGVSDRLQLALYVIHHRLISSTATKPKRNPPVTRKKAVSRAQA